MTRPVRGPIALVVVGFGLLGASAFGIAHAQPATVSRAAAVAPAPPAGIADPLQVSISHAQAALRSAPGDWNTWAGLGSAYVEEGRITADPSYYPKADGALTTSLQIRATGNAPALVGRAALASARHDFAGALRWGMQAQAIAPDSGAVYGVLDDAFTQLGRYTEARAAVQHMLSIAPSLASFARDSYDLEEHGDVAGATAALTQARTDSFAAADVAFCDYYLGELAFNYGGDLAKAMTWYRAARQEDPAYFPAIEGVAKVEAAMGEVAAATHDYNDLLSRVPLPQYVTEVLDYEASLGRTADATAQRSLFGTEAMLFAANGVDVDLETAVLDADHGDPATAVASARAEWSRRHSVLVADALAWALHADGRDGEALTYANQALALGWQNALMLFHRAMIEKSLGMVAAARSDLTATEHINPYFSTTWAATAKQTLAALGGPA